MLPPIITQISLSLNAKKGAAHTPPLPPKQATPNLWSANTPYILRAVPEHTKVLSDLSFFHYTDDSLPPDSLYHSHSECRAAAAKTLHIDSFLPAPPASDDRPPPCVPEAAYDNNGIDTVEHNTGKTSPGNCRILPTPSCTMYILTDTLYRSSWHMTYPPPQWSSSRWHAVLPPAFLTSALRTICYSFVCRYPLSKL